MNPENVNIWSNLISSLGFPIIAAVALAIYVYKTQKAHAEEMRQMREEQTAQLKDIRDEHKEEIKELTKAVDRLSDLVTEFVNIRRGESNVSDKVGISEKG